MSVQGASSAQKPATTAERKLYVLTGGIGTGKSTVAELFHALGATIIDADQLARQVVMPGTEGLKQVVTQFGKEFLDSNGELDRRRLATLVFSDHGARGRLEKILHPLIRQEFLNIWCNFDRQRSFPVLYVVPLFFESEQARIDKYYPEVLKVIVVWAPEAVCRERLKKRDQLTEIQAIERISSQIAIDEKVQKADWVIRNDGDLSALKPQVDQIWRELGKL